MNRPGHGVTFQPMPPGRVLRLLLLALPLVLGLAAGADHPRPFPLEAVSTVSPPRESLPTPVHNEATCAFCQAAMFPPCAPHPTSVSIESFGLVRRERALVDPVAPSFTSHRAASSRAPPPLRLV